VYKRTTAMTRFTWNEFVKARDCFRSAAEEIAHSLPELRDIQQKLADSRSDGKNLYKVETPVVYNTALDNVSIKDEIKLILVADNPGRREQALENRRYLVGPSGKIAGKFFRDNPVLGINFHKNVIILNKTPLHSPRTIELRELCRMEAETGSSNIAKAVEESQKLMAEILFEFHQALTIPDVKNPVQVWITGYSEMKKKGIFETYTTVLKKLYSDTPLNKQLFIFRHFSMNQFTIDLKQQSLPEETTAKVLKRIGTVYRKKILGL
jgi:hypothetical protein